ncbi:MAG: hypothetical protein AAGF12_41530 [Myxococcota bacterium]
MFRTASLALVFLACAVSSVSAQRGGSYELSRAASDFGGVVAAAAVTPGHQLLRAEAERLEQVAAAGDAVAAEEAFRSLRRTLHGLPGVPSDPILDAFEEVSFARRATERPRHAARRHARPAVVYAPAPTSEVFFEGRFEDTPVRFFSTSPAGLRAECQAFLSRVRTGGVDEIEVFGATHRNGPSYWSASDLCTIAAANARSLHANPYATVLEGQVEDLPFRFEGTPLSIRQAVRMFVPELVRGVQVDEVVINGQRFRNGPSYWNVEEVTALLEYNVPVPNGRLAWVR